MCMSLSVCVSVRVRVCLRVCVGMGPPWEERGRRKNALVIYLEAFLAILYIFYIKREFLNLTVDKICVVSSQNQ